MAKKTHPISELDAKMNPAVLEKACFQKGLTLTIDKNRKMT
jgi:hypothetical protein